LDKDFDCIGSVADRSVKGCFFVFGPMAENIGRGIPAGWWPADAEANPHIGVGAEVAMNVTQAIVSAVTPTHFDFQGSERQVYFVMDHNECRLVGFVKSQ
jgi:hypothetical protein